MFRCCWFATNFFFLSLLWFFIIAGRTLHLLWLFIVASHMFRCCWFATNFFFFPCCGCLLL
jgi:hypothetical protein